MPRFKLTIEYNGTRYSGWQIQTNARTVQGELVKAVRTVTARERFEVYGAGRTDAGVHALAQVAHLDVGTSLPPATLAARLNEAVPSDIHVRRVEVVPHRFHARHDATARGYLYQISRRRTAFAKPFVWWVRDPLDVARMRAAAAGFAGMRDFASFTDDDPDEKSTTVAIASVSVEEAGALVLVRVVGSHFLWKMVRRMVGLLVAVGTGDLEPREVARALTSRSTLPAKLTAPASGLFLEFVAYGGEAGAPQAAPFVID
jgi:tRNA pseudouridine38-40 synthase